MPFSFMERFRFGHLRARPFRRLLVIARATLDILALAVFVAIWALNDHHDRRHGWVRGSRASAARPRTRLDRSAKDARVNLGAKTGLGPASPS